MISPLEKMKNRRPDIARWFTGPISVATMIILVLCCCSCHGQASASSTLSHTDNDDTERSLLSPLWHTSTKDNDNDIHSNDDDPDCDKHSSKYDPLACWLWQLKIVIPDQEFQKTIFKVNVKGLTCSNFAVQSVDSAYIPSNRNSTSNSTTITNPSINMSVKGISASCHGSYHVNTGMSGDIQVKASSGGHDQEYQRQDDSPALQLSWEFVSSYNLPNDTDTATGTAPKYWMPIALATTQCASFLDIHDLHFSGSISAKIIGMFKGMIESRVSTLLNQLICPALKDAVDPIATETLLSVDRVLVKYLPTSGSTNQRSHHHDHLHPLTRNSVDYLVSNPSSPEQRPTRILQSSDSAAVVDFEKDTPLLLKLINKVNHFLGCLYSDADATNCASLPTKGLKAIASSLLDSLAEQVRFPIPKAMHSIEVVLPMYGRLLVDVQDLRIAGLAQLHSLSLLSPVAKNDGAPISDFHSQLQAGDGLNVTADVNITIFPIPGGLIHGDPLNEVFHVNFNMSTLDATGVVQAALDKGRFQDTRMSRVLDALPFDIFHQNTNHNNTRNATEDRKCLLATMQSLHVADLALKAILESATFVPHFDTSNFGLGRPGSPLLSRKLEEDLDAVLNHFLMLILREYQPLLSDSTSGVVKTELASRFNEWIDQKLNNTSLEDALGDFMTPRFETRTSPSFTDEGYCRSSDGDATNKTKSFFNFTNIPYLETLNEFINKPTSLDSINNAIEKLAEKLQAKFNPASDQLATTKFDMLSSTILPGISLSLKDLQIEGLGSVDHIDVLSPQIDGLHLRDGFSYAVQKNNSFAADGDMPRVHLSLELDYRPRNLISILNLTVALGDIYLDGGSILYFDITRLRQLALSQLLSEGHCTITPFQSHKIYNNKNISRIGNLLGNVSAEVTGGVKFENFTVSADTMAHPSAVSLATSVVAWVLHTVQTALNSATHSSFSQAEGYCTGGQIFGYDDDPPILDDGFKDKWFVPVLSIFLALLVAAQTVFFCGRSFSSGIAGGADMSNQTTAEMSEPLLQHNTDNDSDIDFEEKDKETIGETLLQSTAISAFSRQVVPILVIGTIVLLLSSNISSGATVDLYLFWGERSLELPALFTFSLLNTARDMWQAGIYPLFFLVLIMSGLWPYTKLLLMLGSWITPPTILKPSTRERLLLALDSLGKFALVDTYLFVLMMVAFRYHLDVSNTLSMDVFITPETGFYTFLAATCFSLLMGHFLVYSHRVSEMRHLKPRDSAARVRESVLGHTYRVTDDRSGIYDGEERQLHLTRGFRAVLVVAVLLATALLSVGVTLKCFKFEIGGIAGDFLGDDRTTYYSLLSLGGSLRKSIQDPSSIGILLLEIAYFFYAVAMPLACLGLLLILFLVPMTLQTQRVFLVLAEIANAWSAVEVFVISIIASLLEISTFASFIVGTRCDLIKKIIKEYFESALEDDTDATCFTVRSYVEPTACVLVLGAILNSLVVGTLLRLIHCCINERIQSEMLSSREQVVDDALRGDESKPTTIVSILSWGILGGLFFDSNSQERARPVGYIPQSTDTYSVTPDVNWEEESIPTPHSRGRPPYASPSIDVMETLRGAFD